MLKNTDSPFAACGLNSDWLQQIAFQTEFCKRTCGKIDASNFFLMFAKNQ